MKDLNLEPYLSEDVRAHIEQLEEDPKAIEAREAYMTQKHTKKDYAMMKDLSAKEIFALPVTERKTVKFEEDKMDRYADMVKIEAKKKKQRAKK